MGYPLANNMIPLAQYGFHHPSHSIHVGSPSVNVDVKTTREHVSRDPEVSKVKIVSVVYDDDDDDDDGDDDDDDDDGDDDDDDDAVMIMTMIRVLDNDCDGDYNDDATKQHIVFQLFAKCKKVDTRNMQS